MIVGTDIYNVTGRVRYDPHVRGFCQLPYPGHRNGCPNYGKRRDCPPQAPFVYDFYDFQGLLYFVVVKFDLERQRAAMWIRHPEWSRRQASCVLYWQAHVNRHLIQEAIDWRWREGYLDTYITTCPEAMGVNVIKILKQLGVPVEVKPQRYVHKVAMVGYPGAGIRLSGMLL